MPLSDSALSGIMNAKMKSKNLNGEATPDFCDAVSKGVVTHFLSSNQVSTIDVGTAGAGVGIGKLSGIDISMGSDIYSKLLSKGIAGEDSKPMADAIAEAIVTHFLAANIVNTTNSGVALGSGSGKISGLVPTGMAGLIQAAMSSKSIKGVNAKDFAEAISEGVCQHINTKALVNVVISGAPIVPPVPGVGAGIGKAS